MSQDILGNCESNHVDMSREGWNWTVLFTAGKIHGGKKIRNTRENIWVWYCVLGAVSLALCLEYCNESSMPVAEVFDDNDDN